MRPRDGRGWIVNILLYLPCCHTLLFQSQRRLRPTLSSGSIQTALHRTIFQTASVRTASSSITARTKGNREVQPIYIFQVLQRRLSKSHRIYSKRIFIIRLALFSPETVVYTIQEEILEYHWWPWLTGIAFPVESSLLHDSSKPRIRTKRSVHKGKFVKSMNQTLGKIQNPL